MTEAPAEFVERLQAAFEGRLRIRWSNAAHEFQIEQRVARGLINFPAALTDDEHIRLRDGYFYVMSIRSGDRMPCPRCQQQLTVPVREIRELSCPRCKAQGLEHRVAAGYFPLDDTLITYLKAMDPLRGASRELRAKVDAHNAAYTESQRQTVLDKAYAAGADDFNRIAGIPHVGYSGPTP
ncbi:MAG: hypothetical protein EBS05_26170, partial [Proteobacteria bacterium]|nr:hypothetical protein [Pseudomonadota bacterium]